MHMVFLALASLTCAVQAKSEEALIEQSRSSASTDCRKPLKIAGTNHCRHSLDHLNAASKQGAILGSSNPLKALAMVFLAFNLVSVLELPRSGGHFCMRHPDLVDSRCAALAKQNHLGRGLLVMSLVDEVPSSGMSWMSEVSGRISRASLLRSASALASLLPFVRGRSAIAAAAAAEPSEVAVDAARRAFEAFDNKELPLAEKLFTTTITEWRSLNRGVEELTSLLVARAGVRTDRQDYAAAKEDLDEAIKLMEPTGEKKNGIAAYREYPDAFVQRGLAREGLRDWSGAVSDYDKAVTLWGGTGDGVNPYALSYRGRARSEVGDYAGALADFRAAESIFMRIDQNVQQAAAARSNEAITLYGLGRREEAVKVAKKIIRRAPGYTDMHVMLAADAWDRGDKVKALEEWNTACSVVETGGCRSYRDVDGWLTNVRRWPPVLVEMQRAFLEKQPPVA